jgi:hypothetical protein
MRTIKEGDKVTVYFTTDKSLVGTVEHRPDPTVPNDSWYIDCCGTKYFVGTYLYIEKWRNSE